MTEPEKQKLIEDCYWKLKRATDMAEMMKSSSLSLGAASSLLTLSTEAQSACVYLRSIAAGNEPPKVG